MAIQTSANNQVTVLSASWNSASTAYTALKVDVNNILTPPTSALLDIGTNTGTYTSRFFINVSGSVGIGTNVPVGISNFVTVDARGSNGSFFYSGTPSTAVGRFGFNTLSGQVEVHTANATPLALWTNNSERVRIDTVGNVGIGITDTNGNKVAISGGNLSVTGSVLPGVDGAHDLGNASYRWANIRGVNIYGSLLPTGMTAGSVLYINSSGAVAQNNANFFWDATNSRLGIGTSTNLTSLLTVSSSSPASIDIQVGRAYAVNNPNTGSINFVVPPGGGTRGTHDYGSIVVKGNSPSGINDGGSAVFDLKVGGASSANSDVGVFMRAETISGTGNGPDMVSLYSRQTRGLVVSGSSANVGIGTTIPSNPLHVYRSGLADGSTNTHLLLDGKFAPAGIDSNDIIGISSRLENSGGGNQTTFNIGFSYQVSGNALLLQPSAGNVGIGTNNPLVELSVKGRIYAHDAFGTYGNYSWRGNFYNASQSKGVGISYDNSPGGNVVQGLSGAGNGDLNLNYYGGNVAIGSTATTYGKATVFNGSSGNIEALSLVVSYPADSTYKALAWRDGTNITGQIDTRYDGTTVDMVFGSLYNGGYNSTERMRIKGNGRVGIGVTNPADLFQVGSLAGGNFRLDSAGTGGHYYQSETTPRLGVGRDLSYDATATASGYVAFTNGGGTLAATGAAVAIIANRVLSLFTSTGTVQTPRMTIDGSGNVGVGTTTPAARFHITGSSTATAQTMLVRGGTPGQTGPVFEAEDYLGATLFVVSGSGNTGVGTSNPSGKFEVVGTSGSLMLITDSLSGSLFSVNDVTGLPIFEVFSDDKVVAGAVNTNALVVTGSLVGVGTSSPGAPLDVSSGKSSGTGGIRLGAEVGLGTRTNSTRKIGVISVPHYTNAQSDFTLISGDANNSANTIYIGGAWSENAATEIRFYTAANSTTTSGTARALIDTNGHLLPGANSTYDLGASGTRWRNIYGDIYPGSSAFTAGSVVFAGTSGVLAQNNSQLFWDNANNRLGIGTNSTSYALHINTDGISQASPTAALVTAATGGVPQFRLQNGTATWTQRINASTGRYEIFNVGVGVTAVTVTTTAPADTILADSTGVGIGTNSVSGKLHVQGGAATFGNTTLLVRHGALNGSNLPVLDVQNSAGTSLLFVSGSGKVGIGTGAPNAKLDVSATSGPVDIRLSNGGTAYMNLYAGSGVGALTMLAVQNEPLVLGTNNAERVRILASSDARVGIGTASTPDSTGGYASLAIRGSSGTIESHVVNTTERFRIQVDTGGTYLNTISSQPMVFFTAGAEKARIASDGNVGIGTDNPGQKLVVYGNTSSTTVAAQINSAGSGETTKARLTLSTALGDWHLDSNRTNSGTFSISDGSDVRMTIDSTGQVGIGTAPSAKLHVYNGHIKVSSGYGIDFSDGSSAAGATSEILDDYEHGNWTPTMWKDTTKTTQWTGFDTTKGTYVKVGRKVTATWTFVPNTKFGGSSYLYVHDLPFPMSSNENYVVGTWQTEGGSFAGGNQFGGTFAKGIGDGGYSYMQLLYRDIDSNPLQGDDLTSASQANAIYGTFVYITS